MRLLALNGPGQGHGPWRGALVLQRAAGTPGVLLDPTGALAARLDADPALRRDAGLDRGPRAVVLSSARIDQVAGLIGLRHGQPIELYTSPSIFEDLTARVPVLPEVQRSCDVHWRLIPVAGDRARAVFQVPQLEGLQLTAVAGRSAPAAGRDGDGSVLGSPALALALDEPASGRRAVWLHARHRFGFGVGALLNGADLIVVDAEPGEAGEDGKPDDALVDWLAAQPAPRKWLVGGGADARGPLARIGIELPLDGEPIEL